MEIFIIFGIALVLFFINKMALKTATNVKNEEITREINKKLIQNKKLDELYGRNSGSPIQQVERAIKDVAKNKAKANLDLHE